MELACFESKDLVHASLILSGLDVLLRVIVHSWANKDLLLVAVAWRLKVNLWSISCLIVLDLIWDCESWPNFLLSVDLGYHLVEEVELFEVQRIIAVIHSLADWVRSCQLWEPRNVVLETGTCIYFFVDWVMTWVECRVFFFGRLNCEL